MKCNNNQLTPIKEEGHRGLLLEDGTKPKQLSATTTS
jgi:hypothetical protein